MKKVTNSWKIQRKGKDYLVIPKKLMILNTLWTVKLVKTLTHNKKQINGLCIPSTKVIKLLDSNPHLVRTFFHEITHCVLFELNWQQSETTALTFGLFLESLYDQLSPNGDLQPTSQGLTAFMLNSELGSTLTTIKTLQDKLKKLEVRNEIKKAKKRTKKI